MTDAEVRETVQMALEEYDLDDTIARTASFEEEGVMTGNEGLVLYLADGSEYQLTLVCSKPPAVPARTVHHPTADDPHARSTQPGEGGA
jgi:hypothetical protein